MDAAGAWRTYEVLQALAWAQPGWLQQNKKHNLVVADTDASHLRTEKSF